MKRILYLLLLMFVFTACSEDETGQTAPAELIRAITVAPQSENALRIDINLDFKKTVSYQIEYWRVGDEASTRITKFSVPVTSDKCTLLLLKEGRDYNFRVHARTDNQNTSSDVYRFTTGRLPVRVAALNLLEDKMVQPLPGYLFITLSGKPGTAIMTDTEGEVVWYQLIDEPIRVATFDSLTNTIACITGPNSLQPHAGNRIAVMDLYGKVLLDKEAEKLMPHHEIRRLLNGDLLMVHFVAKKFDLTVQGGGTDETVFGDGLVVMDINGTIKWDWDCFSEISPVDDPNIMKDIEMVQMSYREDWLHANSGDMDEEGNFYITFNWTSEVWKIDGKTKKVIYRLGEKGNVDMPKESYMQGVHCVNALSNSQLMVFDNGRQTHLSRGLTFTVNDATLKAELTHSITLPSEYGSPFQGSVEKLSENLYLFCPTMSNSILFMDSKGNIMRSLKMMNQSYRTQYISKID